MFDCDKNRASRGRPGMSMCVTTLSQKGNKRKNTSTNITKNLGLHSE